MTRALTIDPDIRRAASPPGWLYTDEAVYERLLERAFAPSWQLIGDVSLARVPGQVHPFTLLEGSLAEPMLLARDQADTLRCLSNICTHRGYTVCEAGGVERSLRCRYHGRRFGLDGSFQQMPEFDGVADFPSPRDNLTVFPLERLGSLLFTSIQPAVAFDAWMRPVIERVGWLPLREFRFDAARSRDYLVQCNWALYCENYLEGFHIPFVHAGLNAQLDYGAYRTELFEHASVQIGVASASEQCLEIPRDAIDAGQRIAGYYFWLFPNLMLNFYPWGLSVNAVRPLGPQRTRVSFLTYVWREDRLEQGAGAALDRVEREDEAIVERVQVCMRSRTFRGGRYSPTRETGTHHFHRMLAERLNCEN